MLNADKNLSGLFKRPGIVLSCFALIITTALAITHAITSTRISSNQLAQQEKFLNEVLPAEWRTETLENTMLNIKDPATEKMRSINLITRNGTAVAAIISASTNAGYSGQIKLLIGVLKNGSISGVRVTQHSETPGLGDDIETIKSNWILAFNGSSLEAPQESLWTVKKYNGRFDQFTGATITPKAVVQEVRDTLKFFHQVKSQLFK